MLSDGLGGEGAVGEFSLWASVAKPMPATKATPLEELDEALAGIFKGLVVAFSGSAPSRPSTQGAGVYTAPVASSSLGLCVFCCLLWLQISFFFFFWVAA